MEKYYIKEQFVTYEIALAMKELGFNEPCLGYFPNVENSDKTMIFFDRVPEYTTNNLFDENPTNYHFAAPLWQQCIDWFYSEKNIIIETPSSYEFTDRSVITYHIIINNKYGLRFISKQEFNYNSLYEAREQAILKAIELCKQKEI